MPHAVNFRGFPGSSAGRESAYNAGDPSLIPGLGRSPGWGHGNHSSFLAWRIPMDRGAWRATTRVVEKNQTRLSHWAQHTAQVWTSTMTEGMKDLADMSLSFLPQRHGSKALCFHLACQNDTLRNQASSSLPLCSQGQLINAPPCICFHSFPALVSCPGIWNKAAALLGLPPDFLQGNMG